MKMKLNIRKITAWIPLAVVGYLVFSTGLVNKYTGTRKMTSIVAEYEEPKWTYRNLATDTSAELNRSLSNTESGHKIEDNIAIERESSSKQNGTVYLDESISKNSSYWLSVKERFDKRMAHALDVCKQSNYSTIRSIQIWDRFAFGRLTYCSIPKAGTTFLSRDLTASLRKTNTSPFSESEIKRFFLVREPYSRLVSAFFSKVVGHILWWDISGRIVKMFRPNATEMSVRCGHDTTFGEYIKFVIEMHKNGTMRNPHFLRMMEVCNICADVPDFIAKLETIKDDVLYLLNLVDVTGMTNKSFIEVGHLAKMFVDNYGKRQQRVGNCGSMCTILNRYWYGQQATGLISEDIPLPVKGQECENMTGEKLAELAMDAHKKSVGRFNKRDHKKRMMFKLFQQVPMEDKKEIQQILNLESKLFDYDPWPDFVFPERHDSKSWF